MNTKEDLYKYRMKKCELVHRDLWNKITLAENKGDDVTELDILMEKNLSLMMHIKAKEIKEVLKDGKNDN